MRTYEVVDTTGPGHEFQNLLAEAVDLIASPAMVHVRTGVAKSLDHGARARDQFRAADADPPPASRVAYSSAY